MTYQVFRTEVSSYQNKEFIEREKSCLEELPGVQYHLRTPSLNDEDECILISNTHTRFDLIAEEILAQTGLIIHPNSGHDNIAPELIRSFKKPIIVGNCIRANAVVEYILAAIFAHFCPIPNHFHWHENRQWNRQRLKDKTCLILGQGHIGTLLSQTLAVLCHKVICYDPYVSTIPLQCTKIEKLTNKTLPPYDILIVACSLSSSSHNLINAELLKTATEELLFVNAARGEIVDQHQLKSFLSIHPRAFAYLDTFDPEPFPTGFMGELTNVNKTSHIAGVWGGLNQAIIDFEYSVLEDYIRLLRVGKKDAFKKKYGKDIINLKESFGDET